VRVSKKLPPTDAASSDCELVVASTLPDDVLLNVKEPSCAASLATGDPTGDPSFPLAATSDCRWAKEAIHIRKVSGAWSIIDIMTKKDASIVKTLIFFLIITILSPILNSHNYIKYRPPLLFCHKNEKWARVWVIWRCVLH
jgi:hypothetical protein